MITSQYANISLPILVSLFLFHMPVLFFLFIHRNSQVFKSGCSLELTYLLILGFWFVASWKLAVSLDITIPCIVNSSISSISYFVVIVVYMQRALKVLFRFEVQAALDAFRRLPKEQQTIPALESGPGGWFFRHRNIVRNRYSFTYFFIAFLLFTIINFGLGLSEDLQCSSFNTLDYLNWILDICVIPFAVTLACKLRKHTTDAFNIKRDLGWAGMSAIFLTLISIFLAQAIPKGDIDDYNFQNAMVTVFTMLWLLMISGYKQMYHLYLIDREVEIAESDFTSLENILKLEAGYEAYLAYLKTELNAENLIFWQTIEDYRRKYLQTNDPASAFLDCEHIVHNFIEIGSPMELNIDIFLRNKVMTNYRGFHAAYKDGNLASVATSSTSSFVGSGLPSLEMAPPSEIASMFDEVQRVIFDLMRKDPFRRFMASPLFEEFQSKEKERRELTSVSTVGGIKIAITKTITSLNPKANLKRLTRTGSEGSHSRGSQHSGAEPKEKDKDSKAFNSFSEGGSFALKPTIELTSVPTESGSTTPRGSGYVSPFGNTGNNNNGTTPTTPRGSGYVSPFANSAPPTPTPARNNSMAVHTTLMPSSAASTPTAAATAQPLLSRENSSSSTASTSDIAPPVVSIQVITVESDVTSPKSEENNNASSSSSANSAQASPTPLPRSVSYVSPF